MSRSTDEAIVSLAAAHHRVVTRSQLLDVGVSASAITRRLDGLLRPFAAGVFFVGAPLMTTMLAAALATEPRGAVGGLSAAQGHGLPARLPEVPSIVVPHWVRRTFPDVVTVRRTRHLPAVDVEEVNGLRNTTVERTICDLATMVSARALQRLIEWSITHRRMTASSFRACAVDFCRQGRSGSARIRLLQHEVLDGAPIPASELERRGYELLDRRGLGGYVTAFLPPWVDGVRGVVDIAWPDARLILELDGRRWHAVTEAQANDRRRDRRATESGWVVVRATWDEVVHRPESLVVDLRSILAQRSGFGASQVQNRT